MPFVVMMCIPSVLKYRLSYLLLNSDCFMRVTTITDIQYLSS